MLPGGGARGAYEIGALSVLLPALAARGERVSVHRGPALSTPAGRTPGLADVAANVLDGLLVDQVGQGLRHLAAINSFVVIPISR